MKVVEVYGGDISSNSAGDALAGITNEISHHEQLAAVLFTFPVDVELPSVTQSQVEAGMIHCLYLDLVAHEIWAQSHAQSLDLILLFWDSS
jgi:hypothetical protein